MYYGNIKNYDVANGLGVRVSLFVSGCRNHCPHCFNAEAQNFNYGAPYTEEVEAQIMQQLHKDEIRGITFLGGEPMEPENQAVLAHLAQRVRQELPNKDIWCYTGYTLDTIPRTVYTETLLNCIDVLVDGPFIEALKNPSLAFRGSSNQRIIDMKTSKVMNL